MGSRELESYCIYIHFYFDQSIGFLHNRTKGEKGEAIQHFAFFYYKYVIDCK
jgi:hypothetical protein